MASNIRILISLSIAFLIALGAFSLLYNEFPDTHIDRKNHSFFKEKLEDEKIFLLGSSHVNQLNTTHIVNKVFTNTEKYTVYNLAINADDPKKRFEDIEKIISLNPDIVFYGISYRDFSSISNDQIQQYKITIDINPKFSTMQAIRSVLTELGIFQELKNQLSDTNSPFKMIGVKQTIIETKENLELQTKNQKINQLTIKIENNQQASYFKKIISKLQENDIKVIIFTTPISHSFNKEIPITTKENFKIILNDVTKQFEIKMYNFTNRYSELNIWQNPTHVSYNMDAIIFSEDIANMIIQEVDE